MTARETQGRACGGHVRTSDWSIVAALGCAVVAWLLEGGAAEMFASGGALRGLAGLLGLLSAAVLFVQVMSLARIRPWGPTGSTAARARRHRQLGPVLLVLLALHVATALAARTPSAVGPALVGAWSALRHGPGLLLALLGTGLIVVVATSSGGSARQRLGPRRWRLLHRLGYGALLASLWHQVGAGSLLESWLALAWLTPPLVLVVLRVLRPASRARSKAAAADDISARRGPTRRATPAPEGLMS